MVIEVAAAHDERAAGGAGPVRAMLIRGRRVGLLAIGVAAVGWAGRQLSAVGASWSAAWHLLTHLPWQWPVLLGVVWLLGLCVHTVVLTASMPGLTHRRALTLNLSGSAVANVLPLGGVAGTALNLGMVRGWGRRPCHARDPVGWSQVVARGPASRSSYRAAADVWTLGRPETSWLPQVRKATTSPKERLAQDPGVA